MARAVSITTTSYAVLGLLAVQPWTTYELVQQVDRSLGRMWPRTRSKLYEEPKKLEALGYATSEHEPVGKRARTRYSITPEGRAALAAWLKLPGDGPVLEFEGLLKVHFADSGTKADVLASLSATLAWTRQQNEENLATARAYLAGGGDFPERAAINAVTGRFLTDYYTMVANWATWASGVVREWPDDLSQAEPDVAEVAESVRRAEALSLPDQASATGPPH